MTEMGDFFVLKGKCFREITVNKEKELNQHFVEKKKERFANR